MNEPLLGFALAADVICSAQPELSHGVRAETENEILDLLARKEASVADIINILATTLQAALGSADPRLIPLAKIAPNTGQLAATLNAFFQSADPMIYRERTLPDRLGRLDAAFWGTVEHLKENGWSYLDVGIAMLRAERLLTENMESETWPGQRVTRRKQ